mmetsp:Transcript_106428/g.204770  ORF Transcript_106428/g.204770 Transcript_106428/m.204770 type:complete len:383 (-) Transcript_106428:198-1346(-)
MAAMDDSIRKEAALEAKSKGNEAFQSKKFEEAILHFTDAIGHDPSDHVFYSNRSASYAQLEEYEKALEDAAQCVKLKPDWPKGYARKGLAEFFNCKLDDAMATYKAGLELAPNDQTMKDALQDVTNAKSSRLQRGMDAVGWNGTKIQIPFAINNSRTSHVLRSPNWPEAWPYQESDFKRQDESNDSRFYSQPRFCTHIDDTCITAIRRFYALHFAAAPQGEYSVLDLCSSWISHYPRLLHASRVAVTGMSEEELKANRQATEYKVKDLNEDPKLPYGDCEFDFVTNVVSVDYLSRPQDIFNEMHRVTKPGGVAIMSFSNRCFPSKAIAMWVENMNDGPGHCQIVGNYFHFNPEGGWHSISSADISLDSSLRNPMWVVTAVKA